MDIRTLTPDLSVSPQIAPEDAAAIAAAGFRTVICNRPDTENPPELHAARVRAAVEAAGMAFHDLPFDSRSMTAEVIVALRELIANAEAPVLAYCRTGTRCTNAWALGQAGERAPGDIVRHRVPGGL